MHDVRNPRRENPSWYVYTSRVGCLAYLAGPACQESDNRQRTLDLGSISDPTTSLATLRTPSCPLEYASHLGRCMESRLYAASRLSWFISYCSCDVRAWWQPPPVSTGWSRDDSFRKLSMSGKSEGLASIVLSPSSSRSGTTYSGWSHMSNRA